MAGTDSVFASKESGVTAAAQDADEDNAQEILQVPRFVKKTSNMNWDMWLVQCQKQYDIHSYSPEFFQQIVHYFEFKSTKQ